MCLSWIGELVVIPQAEGKRILLALRELGLPYSQRRHRDLHAPTAGDGTGHGIERRNKSAMLGLSAIHSDGKLMSGVIGWIIDADLDDVIAPDFRAIIAHQHIILNTEGEVQVTRCPRAAQFGA